MTDKEKTSTVAIVDDDRPIRNLIRLFLTRAGYRVVECATGKEAEETLVAEAWDLAILDRRLPDMDGVSLANKLKQMPGLRNRYVIMLTGEDEQADKIEGLDLGADDYMTKPFHMPELIARIRAGLRIVSLQNELIEANRRLAQLSITDGLTNLYNHRHFQDELAKHFTESARYDRPLSLALIDIDFFKKVNDTWGHAVGDAVLKQVAALFKESIRHSDLAARYGGEEFGIIMPETEMEQAVTFAEKIREMVEATIIETEQGTVRVTVSIGVSSVPHPTINTPMQLIEDADASLYRAKEHGRNQVQAERRKQVAPFPPRG
ncbi:MAG: diguanylate cyclase [Acidobacteria bacterium]|nr:diguanylate cyclase [Acidobacteriota bacterium]